MTSFKDLYSNGWSEWVQFPDCEKLWNLNAPVGYGVYQLKNKLTGEFVLFGMGSNVAYRLLSLLPRPFFRGNRKNEEKIDYVNKHIKEIVYRTIVIDEDNYKDFEEYVALCEDYIFNT